MTAELSRETLILRAGQAYRSNCSKRRQRAEAVSLVRSSVGDDEIVLRDFSGQWLAAFKIKRSGNLEGFDPSRP